MGKGFGGVSQGRRRQRISGRRRNYEGTCGVSVMHSIGTLFRDSLNPKP